MATLQLVEERIISGKGVFKITNTTLLTTARYYILYLDVIRSPNSPYRNLEWNPAQSLYCRIAFRRNSYVVSSDTMRYNKEMKIYVNDNSGQVLRAVKCAYEGTLASFANLATALVLPVVSITNSIKDYESIALGWDEMLFNCYRDTAIQARVYRLPYDVCNQDNEDTSYPPPPPPPRAAVPPGTPITDISRPYDGGSSDGGNTQPSPGDGYFNPGSACQRMTVTYKVKLQGFAEFTSTVIVFALIGGDITIKPSNNKVAQMFHQGQSPTGAVTEVCGAYELRDLVSFTSTIESISFVSSSPA